MLNSESSVKSAQELAGFLWDKVGSDSEQQVSLLIRRALGHYPTQTEQTELVAFLKSQTATLSTEKRPARKLLLPLTKTEIKDPYAGAALTDLCLAILNTSEFIYVD